MSTHLHLAEIPTQPVIAETVIAFSQLKSIIQNTDSSIFTRSTLHHSSVGKHVRHSLDHYDNFFTGFHTGELDYDKRSRDLKTEQSPTVALQRIEALTMKLEALEPTWDPLQPIFVKTFFLGQKESERKYVGSTLGRELIFLHHHFIHHLAFIRLLAHNEIPFSNEFGKAASTVEFERSLLN